MAWIRIPPLDTPELKRLAKPWTDQGRPVASVIAPLLHRPRSMRGVLQMNNAVTFGGSSLGRRTEELIASTVSALNGCFY
jgi:alkylhydroperoxidase family enzyme